MRALSRAAIINGDEVIGLHMFGDFDWMPSPVDTMSRDRFWYGPWLVIPRPDGEPAHSSTATLSASEELAALLGGRFNRDLSPFIESLSDLVFRMPDHPLFSVQERVFKDRPSLTYVWLASTFDRWQVQALGAPGDFFFISLFTSLKKDGALSPDGQPRKHPLGEPRELLARVAPALAHRQLQADTRYTSNLYDAVFVAAGLRVRMGVRVVSGNDGNQSGEYLYVVRVDTRADAQN